MFPDCLVFHQLDDFPRSLRPAQRQAVASRRYSTYQLVIRLSVAGTTTIGRLGRFTFPAGIYLYTGSSRRWLAARLARHLRREKRHHWHIDYFLDLEAAAVTAIRLYREPECEVNRRTAGLIVVPGFGAGDCRCGCGSHLKYTASRFEIPSGLRLRPGGEGAGIPVAAGTENS